MYTEYKNVPVQRVQKCISLYTEYKLTMSHDTESPQPDDDLYDTESTQPYPYAIPFLFIYRIALIF